MRENCDVGADRAIESTALYEAFKDWSETNEYPKSSQHVFGRDLRAAVAAIRLRQSGGAKNRVRYYVGLSLRRAEGAEGPVW